MSGESDIEIVRDRPGAGSWVRALAAALVLATGLAAAAAVFTLSWYQEHIVRDPGPHLEKKYIMQVIASESPIYYRDGKTVAGVLFDQHHRRYVPYAQIPETFVKALVAAEDRNFFRHWGVDLSGILRAIVQNFVARRLVAGGSTLTQQTAKNLFFRKDRSLAEKWRELQNALRLEARYSKAEILEFYANQFYVNGNGRGIGIAAKYFFDKEPKQLSLIEAAFLAGVVKGPEYYNPFVRDPARRARNLDRAKTRLRYVAARLKQLGEINGEEYENLMAAEIPFKEGKFQYDVDVLVDAVREELETDAMAAALEFEGISDPATAGLSVETTLDLDIQRITQYALRHHLTELGVVLEDPGTAAYRAAAGCRNPFDGPVEKREFYCGVVELAVPGKEAALHVKLGTAKAIVDLSGLRRAALWQRRAALGNLFAKADNKDIDALVARFPAGSEVYVSIRKLAADGVTWLADLEFRPELEGGAIVLREGEILAIAGGYENRHFNRAMSARRQLGSTFKPLVYGAAMQLGWSPLDTLENRRDVFPFQGTFYFPRPDHFGAPGQVSLAWAGAKSENLASVWLLSRLTSRLNGVQFEELAARVRLTQQPGENREQYVARIRDQLGILSVDVKLEEGLFDQAVDEARIGLIFDGRDREINRLRAVHYGLGFRKEREKALKDAVVRGAEARLRSDVLRNSYLNIKTLHDEFVQRTAHLAKYFPDNGEATAPPTDLVTGFYLENGTSPPVLAFMQEPKPLFAPMTAAKLAEIANSRWPGHPRRIWEDVLMDGMLRPATIGEIGTALRKLSGELADRHKYDFEVLSKHADFRILAGMLYVIMLAREAGVESDLRPVLSLTLGASEVTLREAALFYDLMISGIKRRIENGSGPQPTKLLRAIRGSDNHAVFVPRFKEWRIISEAQASAMTEILYHVVQNGTAQRAKAIIHIPASVDQASSGTSATLSLPVIGKTGTTNGYVNSAFVGVLPEILEDGSASAASGYVIAVYAGYDDNRPMRRKGIRIAGAAGALPIWMEIARGIGELQRLGYQAKSITTAKSEIGFAADKGAFFAAVHPETGIAVSDQLYATRAEAAKYGVAFRVSATSTAQNVRNLGQFDLFRKEMSP